MNHQRITLITGASKGIGLATAKFLAHQGHKVIGIARHAPQEDFPGEFVTLDLADVKATDEILTELTKRFQITGLVNNVGLVSRQALGEIALTDLSTVLDLNLRPALQITQALLPTMKAVGWGRIVNVSSLTVLGIANRTCYAAAKSAIISFTRSWALELAQTGITVNAVAPGPIETEMFRENNPPGSEGEQRYLSIIPMKRVGKPEEIAAAIAFFFCDQAAFITGQTLFVDGGASIGCLLT